jgi:hypothetical protein
MANLRQYIYDKIRTDSVISSLGFDENSMFNTNDVDTPQVRPMMIFRWGAASVGLDIVNIRSFQVWVHDERSDYTLIDQALERVRTVLTSVVGESIGDVGKWVVQIEWTGDSEDLDDDVQQTVTRYSQFNLVGSAG